MPFAILDSDGNELFTIDDAGEWTTYRGHQHIHNMLAGVSETRYTNATTTRSESRGLLVGIDATGLAHIKQEETEPLDLIHSDIVHQRLYGDRVEFLVPVWAAYGLYFGEGATIAPAEGGGINIGDGITVDADGVSFPGEVVVLNGLPISSKETGAGWGTATPYATFHVHGPDTDSNATIRMTNATTFNPQTPWVGGFELGQNWPTANDKYIWNYDDGELIIATDNDERIFVTPTGVGFGQRMFGTVWGDNAEVDILHSVAMSQWLTNANGPAAYFTKSRGGGVHGTHGAVVDNDMLMAIAATGSDGTTFANSDSAVIMARVDGAVATSSVPGMLQFFTTPAGSAWGVERLRLQSSGIVRPGADNTQDFGTGSFRWKTIFAGTGTINTSDRREKDLIRDASVAELAVAKKIAKRIQFFKFKDAIAEKGDAARWHAGVIAQEIINAFESELLDPFAYGCVGFDLLWKEERYTEEIQQERIVQRTRTESRIEIRAGVPVQVEVEVTFPKRMGEYVPVVDEQGNPVMEPSPQPGAPPQPLIHFVPEMETKTIRKSRTVPDLDNEGVQKTRYNVRYDELYAFVIAALAIELNL